MADVYVTYSKWDRARVAPLVALLQGEGWSVWWDERADAGEGWDVWDETSEREAEEAKCIVVAWSVSAKDSQWVLREANDGYSRGILVPVLVGAVAPPHLFADLSAVDLTAWKGNTQAPEARALVAAVSRTAGVPGLWAAAQAAKGAPEIEHWNSIKSSLKYADFEGFLSHHSTGPLAEPAQSRAEQLRLFDAALARPKERTHAGSLWLLAVALVALVGASAVLSFSPWLGLATSNSYSDPSYAPPPEPVPAVPPAAYAPPPLPEAAPQPEAQPQDGVAPAPAGETSNACPKDQFSCSITPGCTWWDDFKICVGQSTVQQQPAQEAAPAPPPVQCPIDEASCQFTPECTWVDQLKVCLPANSNSTEAPAEPPVGTQAPAPVDCMILSDPQTCNGNVECQWDGGQCFYKAQ